ncbi:MAG: response regulator transcription factor [Cephaloticoccus sp.]
MSAPEKPTRQEAKLLILVVEDEVELANLISQHLEAAGMQTQVCHRAAHATSFLQRNFANLLLLDIGLPDQTGFALLDELAEKDLTIPTIFLTGNDEEASKVRALNMGGDDYATKPFSFPELIARIGAVLRRAEVSRDLNLTKNVRVTDEPFEFCGASINPERLEIRFPGGGAEKIGRKELGILTHLNANPGVVITRKALIHSVWGVHADIRSRSLDQYVVKVRDLYKKHGLNLDAFRTVHGIGYIFDPKGISAEGR